MALETDYKLQIYDTARKLLSKNRDAVRVFPANENSIWLGMQLVYRRARNLQLWVSPELQGDSTIVMVNLVDTNPRHDRVIYSLDVVGGAKAKKEQAELERLPDSMAGYARGQLGTSFDHEGGQVLYFRSGKNGNHALHRISSNADHIALGLLRRTISCHAIETRDNAETLAGVARLGIPDATALLRLVGIE